MVPPTFTKARIALAPGRGVSYQFDPESRLMVLTFEGTNPMLILASMTTWINEVGDAIKQWKETQSLSLPAQDPPMHTVEVDEEVMHFLKLKEKENISPNASLRYLLFGENPYLDEAQREDLARAEEQHAEFKMTEDLPEA